jgi:hypothetical protein
MSVHPEIRITNKPINTDLLSNLELNINAFKYGYELIACCAQAFAAIKLLPISLIPNFS